MSSGSASDLRAPADRWWSNPVLVWSAFILVHLLLGMLNLAAPGYPLGDVTSVYKYWADQAVIADYWVGVDAPWVYPALAILPMLAARVAYPFAASVPALADATFGAELYASTWLTLILLLDLVAFGVLTGWGRRRDRAVAAWWWTAFLLCLGPIALGRIDAVTVPVAIVGVLMVSSYPRAAAIVLTAAAWVKVWPGAIVVAMVVALRARARVLLVAAGVSVAIVLSALSFGSGANVFGFIVQQTSRGLQVEAPITTFWMWRAASGASDTSVYFDQQILTWQVRGPGAATASALMTPLLLLVVAAIVLLGVLALRRGMASAVLLPPLVLALVTAMIAFQKVGSPQFMTWLAVPVLLGLVSRHVSVGSAPSRSASPRWMSFSVPAGIVLVLGALTHVMYPYLYGYLIGLFPWMLIILSVRNALLFVLLGWAVSTIVRAPASVPGWTADAAGPPLAGRHARRRLDPADASARASSAGSLT